MHRNNNPLIYKTKARQQLYCHFSQLAAIDNNLLLALNPAEKQRASEFKLPQHQQAFARSRAYLRHTLAHYLDCPAADIEFAFSDKGKPYLPKSDCCFNLSHTDQAVAIIIGWQQQVGIDIEANDRRVDRELLSKRVFTEQEQAFIQQNTDPQRAFLRLWTRKEALVKAMGVGIAADLLSLDTLETPVHDQQGQAWYIQSLTDIASHQIAVSYRQAESQVTMVNFDDLINLS